MEVKPSYKQTEVGLIPEEWAVWRLKDCCHKLNVSFVGTCEPFYTRESCGVLMLRTGNLQGDKIVLNDCKFVTLEFHARNRNSQVRTGDILIARHGNSGNAVLVPPEIDDANALSIVILRTNEAILSNRFASYCINSGAVSSQTAGMLAGSTQVIINTREVEKLRLPLPPLPEQHAITDALSDVDELLGALDRLIAKKRDIKQAAMQQLLTGQTRLPGFSGEWEVKRLGDVGKFLKGSGVTKEQARSGDLACIRYGELYTHHNDVVRDFHSWISPDVAATAVRLKRGDILFAGSGETKEEIGKCASFVSDIEAYAGGDIVILRLDASDPLFLGYCLNTGSIVRQKASRGQGDAVVHISSSALSDVELNLPPLPEQTAIAEALSDMDAELAALEKRREKTRHLKQGMMQELLTGRIRLL